MTDLTFKPGNRETGIINGPGRRFLGIMKLLRRKYTFLAAAIVLIITVFMVEPVQGQRKSDIGFMTAIPWYLGDISSFVPVPTYVPPAIGPIFRYNINMRNSVRAHAVYYHLAAEGEIYTGTDAGFQSSFVDLGLDFEFNWWPYKTAFHRTRMTPYVTAGLGYSVNLTGISTSHLYLPFGAGLKANLGKRLSGGLEVTMRKAFSDGIDGVWNAGGEAVESPVGNNDWYMFTGLFLTYKLFDYGETCHGYD